MTNVDSAVAHVSTSRERRILNLTAAWSFPGSLPHPVSLTRSAFPALSRHRDVLDGALVPLALRDVLELAARAVDASPRKPEQLSARHGARADVICVFVL